MSRRRFVDDVIDAFVDEVLDLHKKIKEGGGGEARVGGGEAGAKNIAREPVRTHGYPQSLLDAMKTKINRAQAPHARTGRYTPDVEVLLLAIMLFTSLAILITRQEGIIVALGRAGHVTLNAGSRFHCRTQFDTKHGSSRSVAG